MLLFLDFLRHKVFGLITTDCCSIYKMGDAAPQTPRKKELPHSWLEHLPSEGKNKREKEQSLAVPALMPGLFLLDVLLLVVLLDIRLLPCCGLILSQYLLRGHPQSLLPSVRIDH